MEIIGELKWTDSTLSLQEKGVFKKLNSQELKYCITLKKYLSDDQSIKLLLSLNNIVKEQNLVILEGESFISQDRGFITSIELIRNNEEIIADYFLPEPFVMPTEELKLLFTLPLENKNLSFSNPLISSSILENSIQLSEVYKATPLTADLKADKLELIGIHYDGLENIYFLAVTIPNQTLHLFTYNLNPLIKRKFKNKYVGKISEKSNHFQAVMASCDTPEISWYILTDNQLFELTASTERGHIKETVLYKKNYKDATLFTINAWPCTIKDKSFTYGGGPEQKEHLTFSRQNPLVIPFLNFYCIIGGNSSTTDNNIEYLQLPYFNNKSSNYTSNKNKITSFTGFIKENWQLYSYRDIKENYNTWHRGINFSNNCACVLDNKILIFNTQSFEYNEETEHGGYFYSYEPITSKWQRYILTSPLQQEKQVQSDFFDFYEGETNRDDLSFKACTIRNKACIAFLDYKKNENKICLVLQQLF